MGLGIDTQTIDANYFYDAYSAFVKHGPDLCEFCIFESNINSIYMMGQNVSYVSDIYEGLTA